MEPSDGIGTPDVGCVMSYVQSSGARDQVSSCQLVARLGILGSFGERATGSTIDGK